MMYPAYITAMDAAKYLISKDLTGEVFNTDRLIVLNGTTAYEGNIRLNKMLHFAQNLHIAKYDSRLFKDEMEAWPNGPVVKDVVQMYSKLVWSREGITVIHPTIKAVLDFVYFTICKGPIKEIVETSHQDNAWRVAWENDRYNKIVATDEFRYEYAAKYKNAVKFMDIMYQGLVVC